MKDLIVRLQNEAGFSKDQARIAVGIFKNYLKENHENPDLLELMKVKTNRAVKKVKSTYDDLSDKAEDWAEHIENKAKKTIKKAKKKVKKTVDKVSNYLDD